MRATADCTECGSTVAECERLLKVHGRYCCAVCCVLKDTHDERTATTTIRAQRRVDDSGGFDARSPR